MGGLTRQRTPDRTGDVAARMAVLLQAGLAPVVAWRFLAESGDREAAAVLAAHREGRDLPEAIAAGGARWLPIAAAWRVATAVGAPLADTLRAIAGAVRDANECRDEVAVALAEPAATARLMSWLPLVAVLLGAGLGFDTFRILTTGPIGIGCLVAGVLLMLLARLWTRRLVAAAGAAAEIPGLRAELIAIALSGGVSIERAQALAAPDAGAPRAIDADGASAAPAGPRSGSAPDADRDDIDRLLALSRSAGVPAVELLRAGASLARHRARTAGRLRAARLSSSLLLPLGVCVLPAFLFLGVAPMLMSILGSTSLEL
ncbi:type II secretion system F family protein [Microbacterium sp. NPDC089189]|uniref:type II secretion system F family protein n=1 Tax=Microbacterium sp. NPDC089189 TaxID=3154972 RepID=UPI00342DC7D6